MGTQRSDVAHALQGQTKNKKYRHILMLIIHRIVKKTMRKDINTTLYVWFKYDLGQKYYAPQV